jgi:hypothetical protein
LELVIKEGGKVMFSKEVGAGGDLLDFWRDLCEILLREEVWQLRFAAPSKSKEAVASAMIVFVEVSVVAAARFIWFFTSKTDIWISWEG